MQYTQPALFPDTDITGTGHPKSWPADKIDSISTAPVLALAQADELPFDGEPQADTLFGDDAVQDAA
ncbi:hypothetical protein ACFV0Y_16490 [Streptomyces sp. NPDC059569]|uniref:hypothetical protein n=1 Tax=Streptomyces sp. NPDC059569 TaxID=3346869 RepID=UPI0036A81630